MTEQELATIRQRAAADSLLSLSRTYGAPLRLCVGEFVRRFLPYVSVAMATAASTYATQGAPRRPTAEQLARIYVRAVRYVRQEVTDV